MNKRNVRIVLVLRDDEIQLRNRWEQLTSELGLTMADTIRYMISQVWKKECTEKTIEN